MKILSEFHLYCINWTLLTLYYLHFSHLLSRVIQTPQGNTFHHKVHSNDMRFTSVSSDCCVSSESASCRFAIHDLAAETDGALNLYMVALAGSESYGGGSERYSY